MTEDKEEETIKDNPLIKYSSHFGGFSPESQLWNDFYIFGDDLLKMKIIKIKVYTGLFQDNFAIFGISVTFRNIITGEIKESNGHIGTMNYIDYKEFIINDGEYLTKFYIRIPDEMEYISQIGYSTNKNRKFLVPETSEDGEDKIVLQNKDNNIIVGTLGYFKEKLDSSGCLFVSKKDLIKLILFPFFMLRNKAKKDSKFKIDWDNNFKNLPIQYQYIWKFINLPDSIFSTIIKYCFI